MKITLNINRQNVFYWEGVISKDPTLDDLHVNPTISAILDGEYKSVHLKKLRGSNLYSARLKGEDTGDRLLFTTYLHKGQRYLLLLERVLNHDYHKAKCLNPALRAQYTEDTNINLEDITEDDFDALESEEDHSTNSSSCSSTTTINKKPIKCYKKTFLQISDSQEDFLKQPLPMLLSGVAGSGKTLIISQFIKNHINNNPGSRHRILYISKSPTLIEVMREEVLHSAELPEHEHQVHVMTYEEMARLQSQELRNKEFVGKEAFLNSVFAKNWQDDAEELYQEMRYMCMANSLEDYLQQGTRNSVYDNDETKTAAFKVYQSYAKVCLDNNQVDLALIAFPISQPYALVVIDEAQDFSPKELFVLTQLAEHQQHCFCFDPNQRIAEAVSTIPMLKSFLVAPNKPKLSECHLSENHRNSKAVIEASNAVATVRMLVTKGLYPHEYTQQKSSEEAGAGFVKWVEYPGPKFTLPERLQQLLKSADCAVVVRNEARKNLARNIFNTRLVFTVAEIKGLEFKYIIVFNFLEDQVYKQIEYELPEKEDRKQYQHRPKDSTDKSNIHLIPPINELFTAYTRAKQELLVVEKTTRDKRKLLELIKEGICPEKFNAVETPVAESSDQEWQKRADDLRKEKLFAQANAIEEQLRHRAKAKKKPKPVVPEQSDIEKDAPSSVKANTLIKEVSTIKNLEKLLKSPNFEQEFFLLQPGQEHSRFHELIASIEDKKIGDILEKMKQGNRQYGKLLAACRFKYLFEKISALDETSWITPFDALCKTENGMQFLFLLAYNIKNYFLQFTPKLMFSKTNPLNPTLVSPFTALLSSRHSLVPSFLKLIFVEHLNQTFLRNLHPYFEEILSALKVINYSERTVMVLEGIIAVNRDILPGLRQTVVGAMKNQDHSFVLNMCQTFSGIRILLDVYNLGQDYSVGITCDEFYHTKQEQHYTPFMSLAEFDGKALLMRIFKENPHLIEQMNETLLLQVFPPRETCTGVQSFSTLMRLAADSDGCKFLVYLFKQRPDLCGSLSRDHLYAVVPSFKFHHFGISLFHTLLLNKHGIQVLQLIYQHQPGLLEQLPVERFFHIISERETAEATQLVHNRHNCSCQHGENKIKRFDELTSLLSRNSPFSHLSGTEEGCALLLKIFSENPMKSHTLNHTLFCHDHTQEGDFASRRIPVDLLLKHKSGRQLLSMVFSQNPQLVENIIRLKGQDYFDHIQAVLNRAYTAVEYGQFFAPADGLGEPETAPTNWYTSCTIV